MPLIAGAVISGVGSLVGGIFGSSGAKSAGNNYNRVGQAAGQAMYNNMGTAVQGIQNATAQGQQTIGGAVTGAQNGMSSALGTANAGLGQVFQGQTQATQPYMQLGQTAANNFNTALGPGGALSGTFNPNSAAQALNTQGLQFQQQQGAQAIENSAAALGLGQSGATAKNLEDYSQGLASTYYQQAYNNQLQSYQTNFSNALNANTAASQIGLSGTQQYNTAAQNYGNTTSANNMNAAMYSGNAGMQGGLASAQMGQQGAEYGGNLQLQGANMANQYYMQGAAGQAAGTMGSTNAWQNAFNGMGSALGGAASGGAFGGLFSPSYTSMTQSLPFTQSPALNPSYGLQPIDTSGLG